VRLYPALHRPANFIETALSGIARDLVIGALMIARCCWPSCGAGRWC
jgi:hypothetical protein